MNPFTKEQVDNGDVIYLSGDILYIREKDGLKGKCLEVTLKNVYYYNQIKSKSSLDKTQSKILITRMGQTILCTFDLKNDIKVGHRIFFNGNLTYFTESRNPGEFNQALFYSCRGVLFSSNNSCIIAKSKSYDNIRQFLYTTRTKNEAVFKKYLAIEDAAIMKAMLLGEKSEIDTETKELFQKNGIAHILAISGLHISFIGMTLFKLLQQLQLPKLLTFVISETTIILYVIMVGFSPSSFRALFMFSLFLLSKLLKRSYDMITALGTAGILLLLEQPMYLFDCAFLLSFLAIAGIGVFCKRFTNLIYHPPKYTNGFFSSLFVFLTTLPVMLYFYFEISFLSIFLNLIVIPLMSVLLVSGILLLFLDGITILCVLPAGVVSLILLIYKTCCVHLERFDMGRYNLGRPHVIQIVIYYILFILSCYLPCKKKKTVFVTFVFLACFILFTKVQNGIDIYMIDVGQGDSCVIINENRNVYMIDGGSSSKTNIGKRRIIPFLKSKGIGTIEAVFLSHPDSDHMNGIQEILENDTREQIHINTIYILDGTKKEYENIVELARKNRTEISGIRRGFRIEDKSLVLNCIYPKTPDYIDSLNNSSLIMDIEYHDFHMLSMGDLEASGEQKMLPYINQKSQQYNALKVSHHGSNTSTSEAFLSVVNPEMAIVSCGKNNPYGHPHKEVILRLQNSGCQILQTRMSGCIDIHVNKNGKKKVTGFCKVND